MGIVKVVLKKYLFNFIVTFEKAISDAFLKRTLKIGR